QLESATLSNDTTSVADANASGGNVAETAYTTNPTVMAKRCDVNLTTLLECLRGRWKVRVRVKSMASARHVLQMRWAPSSADPAPYGGPEVVHDPSLGGAVSFGYVKKDLGSIFI